LTILNNLIKYWEADGLTLPTSATISDVRNFEKVHKVLFPEDFSKYLLTVNGNGEEMGNDMYRFWSLNELQLVSDWLSDSYSDRFDYPDCFVFADFLVWSHAYAVCSNVNSESFGFIFEICTEPKRIVAHAFTEFLQEYLANPERVP
jgi:hypothetical protein